MIRGHINLQPIPTTLTDVTWDIVTPTNKNTPERCLMTDSIQRRGMLAAPFLAAAIAALRAGPAEAAGVDPSMTQVVQAWRAP